MSYDLKELQQLEKEATSAMSATANEEDVRRAAEWYRDAGYNDTAHDLATLAAQFAAVRAPLEARIAELAESLDVVNRVNAIATCREKALRDAAAVCIQMPVAHVHRHAWRAAAAAAESVILALIEAPAAQADESGPPCDVCGTALDIQGWDAKGPHRH